MLQEDQLPYVKRQIKALLEDIGKNWEAKDEGSHFSAMKNRYQICDENPGDVWAKLELYLWYGRSHVQRDDGFESNISHQPLGGMVSVGFRNMYDWITIDHQGTEEFLGISILCALGTGRQTRLQQGMELEDFESFNYIVLERYNSGQLICKGENYQKWIRHER